MISDIDYMKFAMSQERDKTEIDPVLRSKAWSAVILGLRCSGASLLWLSATFGF